MSPMFRRIRESYRILAYKEPAKSPFNKPDIMFEEEEAAPEIHRVSHVIGGLISVWILVFISTTLGNYLSSILFPQSKPIASVGTISALLVTVVLFLLKQVEQRVHQKLDFGDYLAPFFGHRLHHTHRILKG